jgi:hypothetical protein
MKTFEEIRNNPKIEIVAMAHDGGACYMKTHSGGKAEKIGIIFSNGAGWEHVSASLKKRCPTWEEMCKIKDIFFNKDECAIQYHPAEKDYVNNHPYCLHIWKPIGAELPQPPTWLVGFK